MKRKNKRPIDWQTLLIGAALDLIVGLILLILDRL